MTYSERDSKTIWHPYTQMQINPFAKAIVRGSGPYLYDEDNRQYIDAVSAWWVNLHGHCHPDIVKEINLQCQRLDHVMFAGYTHPPAVELAEKLLSILPSNQQRVFYSDNGSTAVEVALKMALQYWHNKDQSKNRIIYLEGAYHGDTFGAMATSERSAFTRPFQSLLFEAKSIPFPDDAKWQETTSALSALLQGGDVAAFIYEPLIQGTSGFRFYGQKHLSQLIQICRQHGVLTIADEVMTGFCRTGPYFASQHIKDQPDIICMSKGLTGGLMPLAVTSCSKTIFNAFLSDDRLKTFFHGHSYTANPIACVSACASFDILTSKPSIDQRQSIARYFQNATCRLSNHSKLEDVRALGQIFAANIRSKSVGNYFSEVAYPMTKFFFDRGIIIRPLGNVFYLIPPYCTSTEDLDHIFETFEEFLKNA